MDLLAALLTILNGVVLGIQLVTNNATTVNKTVMKGALNISARSLLEALQFKDRDAVSSLLFCYFGNCIFIEMTLLLSSGSLATATMSSNSSFGSTDEEAVYELASLFHSSILEILAYGIYTTVYFVALYLTLSHGNGRRVGSAVLITVMWILVTIQASNTWAYLENVCVQHSGETREAQLEASLSLQYEELFPLSVTNYVVALIGILLADITMIWRCWVLYGRRWLIVIIPGSSLVAVLGAYIIACNRPFCGSESFLLVSYVWRAILFFRPSSFTATRSNRVANLQLSYQSATVITNIFCTAAIICRIAKISGWRNSFKTYRGLMEILIESSVLYTTIYMVRIGLNIHTQYFTEELDNRVVFAQALGYSITGFAPTLIITRVAAGFARPDDSWTRTSLPHMRSTMRSLAESLHFAQPTTGTVTDNVDLERSIRSDVSAAAGEGDEPHPESPRQSAGGAGTGLREVSKDV